MRIALAIVLILCASACGPDPVRPPGTRATTDGGSQAVDAQVMDATTADTGSQDAGPADAGRLDSGLPDAGTSDSGRADAGSADTGVDAGTPDTGAALDAGGGPISVSATFTYSGGSTLELEGCYFCDATLDTGAGQTLLRFQMGGGYTLWTLTLPPGVAPGTITLVPGYDGAHVSVSESTASLPTSVRGSYLPPGQSGTLTLDEVDRRTGGVIAGRVDAVIQKLGDASSIVRVQASFRAEL